MAQRAAANGVRVNAIHDFYDGIRLRFLTGSWSWLRLIGIQEPEPVWNVELASTLRALL